MNDDIVVINMAPNDTKVEDQTKHTGTIRETDQMATKNEYKYNASGTNNDTMDINLTLHKTVTGNTQNTARQVDSRLIKLTHYSDTLTWKLTARRSIQQHNATHMRRRIHSSGDRQR